MESTAWFPPLLLTASGERRDYNVGLKIAISTFGRA
jgi:hypothetical protein